MGGQRPITGRSFGLDYSLDLSTSQRKSDNYCLEFFFSLFEKHKSKIITSFYREFIQLSENIYFVMKNITSKEDI